MIRYHGSTGNTARSSLSKKAQGKIQEPQLPSATQRGTSLGLVFFSKYVMLDLSFKEKNIISHSQPDPPQLPFANIVFKDRYFVASRTANQMYFPEVNQTCLFNIFIVSDVDTKYLKL